ncbi:hypothetical protein K1X84_06780, partial [bacterium]|nr:hypothetical protein [bacterium]
MKRFIYLLLWALLLTGCSGTKSLMNSKDGSYDYYALKDALGIYMNKPVTVHVGDVEIQCVMAGLESDRVIIRQGDRMQEIPVRAISRIELDDIGRSLLRAGGVSALGGVAGWLAGKVVSSKVLASEWQKFKDNDKQFAAAAAGAAVGFLAGAWYGSRKASASMVINPNVEPLILDRSVGRSISELQRQKYGLFEDLPMKGTESVVRVQIMQYGPTDYLILYNSVEQPELPKYAYDGRALTLEIPASEVKLSWMPVKREYLVKQQNKIHNQLDNQDNQLKYRLFQ